MSSVKERLLKYVKFDTTSDPKSESCPSTEKQKRLGQALVEEMQAMGLEEVGMDETVMFTGNFHRKVYLERCQNWL